jgi:hypothetical protein
MTYISFHLIKDDAVMVVQKGAPIHTAGSAAMPMRRTQIIVMGAPVGEVAGRGPTLWKKKTNRWRVTPVQRLT